MIDLTGITPIADATIGLLGSSIQVAFREVPKPDVHTAVTGLEDQGISVLLMGSHRYMINSQNWDQVQLAERIASYLESQQLQVQRLVPDRNARDLRPKVQVQSFVLG